MKKYLKLKDNGQAETHLEIELYYSLGGMNWWTYETEKRGYYISVIPVEKGNGMIGCTAFSGIRQLVKSVKRKSEKAETEANILAKQYEQKLIDYVLEKNGFELEESA